MNSTLSTLALLALVSPLRAGNGSTTTEDFETEQNPAGWSFNVTTPDRRVLAGGNPGAWLRNPNLVSFAPILTTNGASTFTGDFRARNVTRISLDARTDAASFGAGGRQLSLLLRDTKGTPGDPVDDDYAYFVGPLVPQVGAGWVHYDFDVPSASTVPVPPGWSGGHAGDLENFRPGVDWNDVIANVDRVEVWWLDPSFFALIQTWDVGVDNLAIETGGALQLPRNGSGVNPTTLSGVAPPALGTTWHVRLDCSNHVAGLAFFLLHTAPAEGLFTSAGELLVDLSSPRLLAAAVPHLGAHGGGSADLMQAIPNDPALCGLAAHLQGACGPGIQLSNALDLVVGQ